MVRAADVIVGAPGKPGATALAAFKRFRAGTHRTISPEETIERARSTMALMGITRIADVTGLDTIGLPVVLVCRPNARSLSVSQGKGLTLAAAEASGLMESIEHYHAERIELPLRIGTLDELGRTTLVIDVAGLPRRSVAPFSENLRILWVAGHELLEGSRMSEAPTWVPFEIVHTDFTLPVVSSSGCFLLSSSGLASGNHVSEAISHAICELVERDATTLWRLSSNAWQQKTCVDLSTVDDPDCRAVLDTYARAGVDVFVWETTSDIQIPAFLCTIVDHEPNPYRPLGPMTGMGCHPSRAIALLRALTEAAQSRLTVITGSRDDVGYGRGSAGEELEEANRFLAFARREPPARSFLDAPDRQGESFEGDIAWELDRLHAAGLRRAVVIDLTRREIGIPVVRVVIPGLEPFHEIPGYVPGARALRRIVGGAA